MKTIPFLCCNPKSRTRANSEVSKEIWLGPVLGTNRERLLSRCAEYFSGAETGRLIYIAASQPLLELVTEELLAGDTRGVWGDFPLYLFRGFVQKILAQAVLPEISSTGDAQRLALRTPIDREEFPLRRSLISQIIKQLSAAGKLSAMKPLVNHDGCVNTIASLIGELQRAGKSADEFSQVISAQSAESPRAKVQGPKSQLDFDREVALIYRTYAAALDAFDLTDQDADQLRALQILRGDFGDRERVLPRLAELDLLVLDGFFDFTPVQGEILRQLFPAIPNVIVNVNHDQRNPEIFRPFESTIDQLKSMADFEVKINDDSISVKAELSPLRQKLFNVTPAPEAPVGAEVNNLRYFECSDRDTEIRAIAKEIKRLVFREGYALADIALVLRERSAYAETIARVLADESIPCNLERKLEARQIACVRACFKLFDLLREPVREHVTNATMSDIAHVVKSGYFRLAADALAKLVEAFDARYGALASATRDAMTEEALPDRVERLRLHLGIGRWAPDVLENVFAYVGAELRVDAWLNRAQKIIAELPTRESARFFLGGDKNQSDGPLPDREQPDEQLEKNVVKAPAPVHPAAIAWTILVIEYLREVLAAVPAAGSPEELRTALMMLLEKLRFSKQVSAPLGRGSDSVNIPETTVDVRGLEALRRALNVSVRSFNYAHTIVTREPAAARSNGLTRIRLSVFIEEVERSVDSQVLSINNRNRDGLRVLEATDVRGLRFRALFVAGLTEGGFPLRTSGDWLYPHDERERLRKQGVVLEDISNETLLKEEHYFYQAACRATERLYLSRPIALNDGTETVVSYYIDELRRAISPATLATVSVRADLDQKRLRDSSTGGELTTLLIRQSERGNEQPRRDKDPLEKLITESATRRLISDSALRRVTIERQRNSPWFGQFDGELSNPELKAMVARHFGAEYVYSASSLSTYGKCPFRFFASRVLKLEPRNEAALDLPAIDAGKLLHEILRRFFEGHRREYLPALNSDRLRAEISEIADTVFREHERLVPALNERIWKIDCEIRKLILEQVLLFELQLQKRSNARGIRPTFFELGFGRSSPGSDPDSRTDHLRFSRQVPSGAETILVQGQIDRVDLNHQEKLAIAYDYKLSQGAKLTDIESAREMQIPIYLAALEEMFLPGYQLAGGGYYRLRARSGRLNQGLYRRMFEDCTLITGRTMCNEVQWSSIREAVRKQLWQFVDHMRAGDFRVDPSLGKQTCKFCDYPALCRYDTYRINRKRRRRHPLDLDQLT